MVVFAAAIILLLACVAVAGWIAPQPEHTITCHACGHESTGHDYQAAYHAHIIHNYENHH